MSIDDINNFAINNNIYLSHNELKFIYNYINNNYLLLLEKPNEFDISKYKNIFSNDNYIKISNLIEIYKKKYNIY